MFSRIQAWNSYMIGLFIQKSHFHPYSIHSWFANGKTFCLLCLQVKIRKLTRDQLSSLVRFKTTSLNWISLVMKVDTRKCKTLCCTCRMVVILHYYFCCLIACGIAKPIAIPVGMAMIFLLKSNSSNGITSRLYSRDMGFCNPSYQLSSLVTFKTTSLNWISLVMKVDNRDYKNHWVPSKGSGW